MNQSTNPVPRPMKSHRSIRAAAFAVIALGLIQPAPAAPRSLTAVGEYVMAPGENMLDAGWLALMDAERNAWIKAGTYLETVLGGPQRGLSTDQVMACATVLMRFEEADRRMENSGDGGSPVVRVEVRGEYDPEIIKRQMEALMADEETGDELESAYAETERCRTGIAERSAAIRTAGAEEERDRLARERRDLWRRIDTVERLSQAWLVLGGRDGLVLQPASTSYDRRQKARIMVSEALTADPESPRAHRYLGIILSRGGDTEGAMREYIAAIRIDSTDARAYNDLGIRYEETGELRSAIIEYRQALKFDPGFTGARLNYAEALNRAGLYSTAIGEFQTVLEAEPGNLDAHLGLGIAYYSSRNFREGIAVLHQLVEIAPKNATARFHLGKALKGNGDGEAAEEHFRACISLTEDEGLKAAARKELRGGNIFSRKLIAGVLVTAATAIAIIGL